MIMIYPRTQEEAHRLELMVSMRLQSEGNQYSSSDFLSAISNIPFKKDEDNVIFAISDWSKVLWNDRVRKIFDTQRPYLHYKAVESAPSGCDSYHGSFLGNDGVIIRIWTSYGSSQ
jgi:hypothetical protein